MFNEVVCLTYHRKFDIVIHCKKLYGVISCKTLVNKTK